MSSFLIQTPLFAVVPTCARLRVAAAPAAAWAAAKHDHTNVMGSPPRGAPV